MEAADGCRELVLNPVVGLRHRREDKTERTSSSPALLLCSNRTQRPCAHVPWEVSNLSGGRPVTLSETSLWAPGHAALGEFNGVPQQVPNYL